MRGITSDCGPARNASQKSSFHPIPSRPEASNVVGLIMRPLPCPACRHAMPRALDDAKERVLVAFYSCNSCGHVWATDAARRDYVHFVPEFRRKADRRLGTRLAPTDNSTSMHA